MDNELKKNLLNRSKSLDPVEQFVLAKENLSGILDDLNTILSIFKPLLIGPATMGSGLVCEMAQMLSQKVCSARELIQSLENNPELKAELDEKITETSGKINQVQQVLSSVEPEIPYEIPSEIPVESPKRYVEAPPSKVMVGGSKLKKINKNKKLINYLRFKYPTLFRIT
jgi:hypothetical protein